MGTLLTLDIEKFGGWINVHSCMPRWRKRWRDRKNGGETYFVSRRMRGEWRPVGEMSSDLYLISSIVKGGEGRAEVHVKPVHPAIIEKG